MKCPKCNIESLTRNGTTTGFMLLILSWYVVGCIAVFGSMIAVEFLAISPIAMNIPATNKNITNNNAVL